MENGVLVTKIELVPRVTLTSDSGAVAKIQANITHQSKCTSDWNCLDEDGKAVQFREGYVEMTNLDFAPEVAFWGGETLQQLQHLQPSV